MTVGHSGLTSLQIQVQNMRGNTRYVDLEELHGRYYTRDQEIRYSGQPTVGPVTNSDGTFDPQGTIYHEYTALIQGTFISLNFPAIQQQTGQQNQRETDEQRRRREEEARVTQADNLLRDNIDCRNFIAELLSIADKLAVHYGTSLNRRFAPVSDINGNPVASYDANYALTQYRTALSDGRVSRSGGSGRNGDVITYGVTTNYTSISWNNEYYDLDADRQALHILHESLHLIKGFSDGILASSAHLIDSRTNTSSGTEGTFASQSAASVYLNQQIADHCR